MLVVVVETVKVWLLTRYPEAEDEKEKVPIAGAFQTADPPADTVSAAAYVPCVMATVVATAKGFLVEQSTLVIVTAHWTTAEHLPLDWQVNPLGQVPHDLDGHNPVLVPSG